MTAVLTLDDIRQRLEGLEDTIILALVKRKKRKRNSKAYGQGPMQKGYTDSLFQLFYSKMEDQVATVDDQAIEDVPINKNPIIRDQYLKKLDLLCEQGDDEEYEDTVRADIKVLTEVSKRVHSGMCVMEAKYHEDGYDALVKAGDYAGVLNRLTNREVEAQVLARVREKAAQHGLDPDFIHDFYKDCIIPLTRRVEVEYIFLRTGHEIDHHKLNQLFEATT